MPSQSFISQLKPATSVKYDLAGQEFGSLTALLPFRTKHAHLFWQCVCVCGELTYVYDHRLLHSLTTACIACTAKERGRKITIHGMTGTHTYSCWKAMLQRTQNTNSTNYPAYGGAGIMVDPRWLKFAGFLADMGPAPSDAHSIDRIENGNYGPGLCRWATQEEQNLNKLNTRKLTVKDRTQTLVAWAVETGLPYYVLVNRIKLGWDAEDIVITPVNLNYSRRGRLITYAGQTMNITDWAKNTGINRNTVWYRLVHGWPLSEVFKELQVTDNKGLIRSC